MCSKNAFFLSFKVLQASILECEWNFKKFEKCCKNLVNALCTRIIYYVYYSGIN